LRCLFVRITFASFVCCVPSRGGVDAEAAD
jgi:hypothetical protein